MEIISDYLTGSKVLQKDTRLYGSIDGDVTVSSNTILYINGKVNGQLTVKGHAKVKIYGQVVGDILNYGSLEIYGTLIGNIQNKKGSVYIDPSSIRKI